jgi:hypothetical protein
VRLTETSAARIREITLAEFNRLAPTPAFPVRHLLHERAWFVTEDGRVLGAVAIDVITFEWGYVLVKLSGPAELAGAESEIAFASFGRARDALVTAMRIAAWAGRRAGGWVPLSERIR